MKKRYPIMITVCLAVMIFAVCSVGDAYSWFAQSNQSVKTMELGRVNIELEYTTGVAADNSSQFLVKNTSSLPIELQLSYSFVYRDAEGNDLIKDVSGISIASMELKNQRNEPVAYLLEQQQVGDGFGDNPVVQLRTTFEADSELRKLEADENLNGVCYLQGVELEEGESLHMIWTAQALQGTEFDASTG